MFCSPETAALMQQHPRNFYVRYQDDKPHRLPLENFLESEIVNSSTRVRHKDQQRYLSPAWRRLCHFGLRALQISSQRVSSHSYRYQGRCALSVYNINIDK